MKKRTKIGLIVGGVVVLGAVLMHVHMGMLVPAAAVAHGSLLTQLRLGFSLCLCPGDVKGAGVCAAALGRWRGSVSV
ncbi:MAG: hypothetical protein C4525_07535 [Desulfarculus sp.]|nr:MAG: hypothetical protein C4525_07535 [Desulfarculus sp.]